MKLLSIATLALAACYGAAPPRPTQISLPPLRADAEIAVHSDSQTVVEKVQKTATSCPQGHGPGDPACVVTHYTAAEPVTHTTTTASYGGEPISYGQFKVMTDARWDAKLAELADLSRRCERANIPRYAGIGAVVAGLVAGEIVAQTSAKQYGGVVALVGAGGGMASYALGFFVFGGADCVEAQDLYRYLDVTDEATMNEVHGQRVASEMKALAEQFNAARSGHASAAPTARLRMRR
jgi:hypothetical protein